jgi:hypothetical protein
MSIKIIIDLKRKTIYQQKEASLYTR